MTKINKNKMDSVEYDFKETKNEKLFLFVSKKSIIPIEILHKILKDKFYKWANKIQLSKESNLPQD